MELSNNHKLLKILSDLPEDPGVYQFFDYDNRILYIGKAKNLKKRINSYFRNNIYENNKTKVLIKKIDNIKYIIVDSESDALLLENNLIKKYQPRYNILLKDDKTFPWICIKKENFPRIFYTRNLINDGSDYFGPYTSVLMVKTILSLIKRLYPLRSCNLDLSEKKIKLKKYKPCLEFHVGNCKAPCIEAQSYDEYMSNIEDIKKILKGHISELIKYLLSLMNRYSDYLDFERAQLIKDKIELLEKYKSKSTIVNDSIDNVDVFSLVGRDDDICVNYLRIINGSIVQVHSIIVKNRINENLDEIMSLVILDIRNKMISTSREIITTIMPDIKIPGLKYVIPKKGEKLKLLELSIRNAKIFFGEKLKQSNEINKKLKSKKSDILEKLQKDLKLLKLPLLIECFDNSNFQGTNPVASCVVFKNGIPSKKDYRHFNIKTVYGPNDFASMEEIIYRRYKRLLEEKAKLPELIIIDGGIGQLNAGIKSLENLGISKSVSIIGLAKKLEEIYRANDPIPLYIDKNSSSLRLIQRIRDEAHRFGINFHRLKRSEKMNSSILDQIKGIGDKTKDDLFKVFKSIDNIKTTKESNLAEVVGKSKAKKIKLFLSENYN